MHLRDLYYKLRGVKPHICVKCEHFAISEDWQRLINNVSPNHLEDTTMKAYHWGVCKARSREKQIKEYNEYREDLLLISPEHAPKEIKKVEVTYEGCSWVRRYKGKYCKKYKALEV